MPFEHVTHCLVGNAVAETRHGTHDPVVAPIGILLRDPDNEKFQFRIDSLACRDSIRDLSNLCAIRVQYQARMVPGLATQATWARALRLPISASVALFGSERRKRGGKCPHDAIFSGQVFILNKQLLIDQAGDVDQQANPAILFYDEGP
jgi:hypothetical protein